MLTSTRHASGLRAAASPGISGSDDRCSASSVIRLVAFPPALFTCLLIRPRTIGKARFRSEDDDERLIPEREATQSASDPARPPKIDSIKIRPVLPSPVMPPGSLTARVTSANLPESRLLSLMTLRRSLAWPEVDALLARPAINAGNTPPSAFSVRVGVSPMAEAIVLSASPLKLLIRSVNKLVATTSSLLGDRSRFQSELIATAVDMQNRRAREPACGGSHAGSERRETAGLGA